VVSGRRGLKRSWQAETNAGINERSKYLSEKPLKERPELSGGKILTLNYAEIFWMFYLGRTGEIARYKGKENTGRRHDRQKKQTRMRIYSEVPIHAQDD